MKYSEFIGKPKFETGVQGICYDFNDGVRIWLPKGNFHIKCTDLETCTIIFDESLRMSDCNTVMVADFGYASLLVEIEQNGVFLCNFQCDLKDKNVGLSFLPNDGGALGEIIAIMGIVEKFRCKHQCNIFLIVHQRYLEIFRRSYPNITFVAGEFDNLQKAYQQLPRDIYATYSIEKNMCSMNTIQKYVCFSPVDFRTEGMLRHFAGKLGMCECMTNKPSNTFLPSSDSRGIIQEPYVCISGRASKFEKEWHNSDGWVKTVKYLKELGYRVLCIDGDGIEKGRPLDKAVAEGLEDFTGYKPLQERVDLLYHADFFIGISSGLSWLAWGTGKPVILISGFSLPFTEFYTPYRIINYNVCHGCYNNFAWWDFKETTLYQGPKYLIKHLIPCENTEHYMECSRKIDAKIVCRNIDKLMQDHHLTAPKDRIR